MRRDLYLLLLLFIAIDFLDAYTLPLDSEPTDLDLQWANLDSVQNRPLPCYAGRSYVRMVKKRQKTTGCIGENCGANDGMIPETSATDDQPVKQNDLVDNPGESFELAANLNSGSQGNIFNDGHQNWDDAIASLPLNDAATNIPPSAPTGQNTLDQTETEVSDSMADGALNDAFEIATLPKNPASIIEQDPETGEPLESSCLLPPEDQPNAYLVRLLEFKNSVSNHPRRNAQAILVSQFHNQVNNKYDIGPGLDRKLVYRKMPGYAYASGGKRDKFLRYETRGWLVSWPEDVALKWFEELMQSIPPPLSTTVPNTMHFSTIWVTHVFNALATADSPPWVPVSI